MGKERVAARTKAEMLLVEFTVLVIAIVSCAMALLHPTAHVTRLRSSHWKTCGRDWINFRGRARSSTKLRRSWSQTHNHKSFVISCNRCSSRPPWERSCGLSSGSFLVQFCLQLQLCAQLTRQDRCARVERRHGVWS